jgi:hypothetical protein
MSRARVALTVCAILVLFVTALSATPLAPPAPTLPTTAAFLASLATPASPAPGIGVPAPTPMACPTGFCMEVRRQCNADCAPCLGVAVCLISICDSTCSCQC